MSDVFTSYSRQNIDTVKTDLQHNYKHARLLIRAREWEQGERADDLLLIGQEVADAEAWLTEADARAKEPTPTELQRSYITMSRTVEDRRRRLLRNLRVGTLTFAAVGIIAVVLAVSSLIASQRAQEQAADAEEREVAAVTAVAEANSQLTAASPTLTQVNQQVADAEEREAAATTTVAEANSQLTAVLPTLTEVGQQVAAVSEGQATLDAETPAVASQDRTVHLLDTVTGEQRTQSTPTIEYFVVDNTMLSYPAVEGGTETAEFSWRATGLRQNDTMQMHAWVGGQWALIGEGFAAEKSDTLVIAHPLDFILPRYRLSIVDVNGTIVAERFLDLEYAPPEGTPEIAMFLPFPTGYGEAIPLSAFNAPFRVHWRVTNRSFDSNIVIEQILLDGTVLDADGIPENTWQYAHTSSLVNLQYPGDYADVVLRLRVIDRQTAQTLAQQDLILHVNNDTVPAAELVRFDTSPDVVTPGDTVTVSWDVVNTDAVFIEFYNGYYVGGCNVRLDEVFHNLPVSGSLELPIPDVVTGPIQFRLFADFYIESGSRHYCGSFEDLLGEISITASDTASDFVGEGVVTFALTGTDGGYTTVGETITLTWVVTEGETVTIIQAEGFSTTTHPLELPSTHVRYEDLPLSGTLDVTIPDTPATRVEFLLYVLEHGQVPQLADARTFVLIDVDNDGDSDPSCDTFVRIDQSGDEANTVDSQPAINLAWDSCGNPNTQLRFVLQQPGIGEEEIETIAVNPSGEMRYAIPDRTGFLEVHLEYELEGVNYRLQTTSLSLE